MTPKNIVVVFVTDNPKKKTFHYGLGLAKKFDGKISVLQCLYRPPPTFGFFETKFDEKQRDKKKKSCQKSLEEFVKIGEKSDIPIKIKAILADPVAKGIISYVNSRDFDLVILDSPKLKSFEEAYYENTLVELHKNLKHPLLLFY